MASIATRENRDHVIKYLTETSFEIYLCKFVLQQFFGGG